MHNKLSYIFLGFLLCLLSGAFFLGYLSPSELPHETFAASRTIVYEGDLYTVNNQSDTLKITSKGDIRKLFGERPGQILVGKGYKILNEQSFAVDLFLLDNNGKDIKKIGDKPAEYALFDNRGTSVIYLSTDGVVRKHDIMTGEDVEIANRASVPSLSPDDSKLAYKKMPEGWTPGEYADGSPGIVVKDIKTGKERILADKEADHAAFWTPDGRFIYFFGDNGYGIDSLFMIDSDGKNRTLLTNIEMTEYVPNEVIPSISEPPAISEDGRYFVYESDREIWLIETDLSNRKVQSAKKIGYGTSPAWVEDGEIISIVFNENNKQQKSLVLVDIDGNVIK
jgi:hypothetical protein